MIARLFPIAAALFAAAAPVMAQQPEGFQELKTGDAAPAFSLPGIDGKTWTLSDFKADVLMVYFTSNHCPVCHAAEPRLIKLVQDMKGRSFEVVAINPNNSSGLRVDELGYSKYDDSFEDMKPYAKEQGFTFPYLYDGTTQRTALAYGCLATPHVFIFDKERKLRYQGWLDDCRFSDASLVKRHDARNAVNALLEGKPVPVDLTKPFGCSTKWMTKGGSVNADNEKWAKAPVTLEDIDATGIAALVKNPTKKYRLINVWSTTCVPCVQEFPGVIKISRRMGLREFELITLSLDDPAEKKKAHAFLEKQRAALPDGLKGSLAKEGRKSNNYLYTGASIDDLIKALDPEWQGPQPHTVLIEPGGKVAWRHTGAISETELLHKILGTMTETYQPEKK
ncbi:MAG TPA: redoxin domain-containing protein [Verrucomicrobiales bacterium]|nr:redoxin domain-containing protein [Verrucomicrobiales bacterium]